MMTKAELDAAYRAAAQETLQRLDELVASLSEQEREQRAEWIAKQRTSLDQHLR